MSQRRWRRALLILGGLVLLLVGSAATWLRQEVEYQRITSPDGAHTAIVTHRRYEAFRSMSPGQSGDKAGFVRIEDKAGRSYGRVPVPLVWIANDLEWTKDGADLKLVGTWSFSRREVRFWNEAQTEEIVEQVR